MSRHEHPRPTRSQEPRDDLQGPAVEVRRGFIEQEDPRGTDQTRPSASRRCSPPDSVRAGAFS
jgi:hypothetical protein